MLNREEYMHKFGKEACTSPPRKKEMHLKNKICS